MYTNTMFTEKEFSNPKNNIAIVSRKTNSGKIYIIIFLPVEFNQDFYLLSSQFWAYYLIRPTDPCSLSIILADTIIIC